LKEEDMKRMSWIVLLAATVSLAGCGNGGGSTSSNPTPTPTSSQPDSATPTKSPTKQPHAPATEFNPPGDIPDDAVFVDFNVPGSRVQIKVPEGWPRASHAGTTTFTDHYNSIAVSVVPRSSAPTKQSVMKDEVPALQTSVSSYAAGNVTTVQRQHGNAVLITYLLDSKPDPVTGKVVRDIAERYEFWKGGQEAILTLTGPKGADNVDPWKIVSDSLVWR
jgi:predicted small lipoprotein YifL